MFETNGILQVLLKLAVPVALLSFLMVFWSLKKGLLSQATGIRALKMEMQAMKKARKKARKNGEDNAPINPVHGKWLKFGGGFYGIVALYTYGLIEWRDIADTIAGFGGIRGFIDDLSINLIINILLEGLMNFVAAISWPLYWMSEFGKDSIWIWICIAYAGYWLGMRAAQWFAIKQGYAEQPD